MKTNHRNHPLGTPGASARKMGSTRPPSAFLSLLYNLFPGIGRPVSPWDKGAAGEELVGKRLAKLPKDDWIVMHDLALGDRGRNVDHLVIGRGGVFSVNTKNLSGKVVVKANAFLVDGFPARALHVARDEARRVGERLTRALGDVVDVTPVLVVLTPSLEVREHPEDVHVVGELEVPKWFEARPHVLDPRTAARIYRSARDPNVWSSRQKPAPPDGLSPDAHLV